MLSWLLTCDKPNLCRLERGCVFVCWMLSWLLTCDKPNLCRLERGCVFVCWMLSWQLTCDKPNLCRLECVGVCVLASVHRFVFVMNTLSVIDVAFIAQIKLKKKTFLLFFYVSLVCVINFYVRLGESNQCIVLASVLMNYVAEVVPVSVRLGFGINSISQRQLLNEADQSYFTHQAEIEGSLISHTRVKWKVHWFHTPRSSGRFIDFTHQDLVEGSLISHTRI